MNAVPTGLHTATVAWDTRVGTMELALREGSYFDWSGSRRPAVIQQAYVEGVSTRRVDAGEGAGL